MELFLANTDDINTVTKIYSAVRTKGIRPEHYALATILFVIVLLILFIVNYKGNKNEGKKDK